MKHSGCHPTVDTAGLREVAPPAGPEVRGAGDGRTIGSVPSRSEPPATGSSASASPLASPDPTNAGAGHAVPGSPGPGLSVAAVARRMGVAPATLRTWDRRYGLGPSDHPAGAHRRYTPTDLARLDHMRRLVLAGVPPADAARDALALPVDPASLAPVTSLPVPPPAAWSARSDGPDAPPGRAGGGQVVPIPGGTPAARGLARAAASLDTDACTAAITQTLDRRGVIWTWDHLLVPVLRGIGDRWAATGSGIEVEHVLSQAATAALGSVVSGLQSPACPRGVLLACADEESHVLPLWAVAAALAERHVAARMLGARVPPAALATAVRRTGPAAILLWSQTADTGDPVQLTDLPRVRPNPAVLVGGPGWAAHLPAGVERVEDLTAAVTRLAHAVGQACS